MNVSGSFCAPCDSFFKEKALFYQKMLPCFRMNRMTNKTNIDVITDITVLGRRSFTP